MAAGMEYAKVPTPGPRLATIRGMPVHLSKSWLLITPIVVLVLSPQIVSAQPGLGPLGVGAAALACVGVFMASGLAHEGAHAVVAAASGCRVPRVVVRPFGMHETYTYSAARPMTMALVALAGPVANILLAILGGLALPFLARGTIPGHLVHVLIFVNCWLAALDLLPGPPGDGGILVQSIAWQLTGSRVRGVIIMAWCGRVLALAAVLTILGLPLVNPAFFSLLNVCLAAAMGLHFWAGANRADRIVEKARSMANSSGGLASRSEP
jgi:Zn-dependent protease